MQKHNFKKLIIWQDAMAFCKAIYRYTENLPSKEKHNLISQIEKCGVSIPSNIAEGTGKRTNTHFAEFLSTSLSSSYEIETQLLICEMLEYGKKDELYILLTSVNALQSKIFNFREKIANEK